MVLKCIIRLNGINYFYANKKCVLSPNMILFADRDTVIFQDRCVTSLDRPVCWMGSLMPATGLQVEVLGQTRLLHEEQGGADDDSNKIRNVGKILAHKLDNY